MLACSLVQKTTLAPPLSRPKATWRGMAGATMIPSTETARATAAPGGGFCRPAPGSAAVRAGAPTPSASRVAPSTPPTTTLPPTSTATPWD